MIWDHEVDVVCTGSGVGGLATAIVAADDGMEVLVARSPGDVGATDSRPVDCRVHPWLMDIVDPETVDYFGSLSADQGPLNWGDREADIPVRQVHTLPPVESRRTVEPFFGARLKDWAASCLGSPYGFLSTRISGRCPTTRMRTRAGESVEVAVVGSPEADAQRFAGLGVAEWLLDQACERDIEMTDAGLLQRIVFEEGEAVGAVLATPTGPYAVRARRMLMVAPVGGQPNAGRLGAPAGEHETVRVCLVMQAASRFGRVELLTLASDGLPLRPTCKGANRRLHDSAHDAKQASSHVRCHRTHGFPPFGQ